MKYQWVLFDADDTLFHFDAKAGLQHMFAQHDVDFSDEHFFEYKRVNDQLWVDYQNNQVTVSDLKTRRFTKWAEHLSISPETLNNQFLASMAKICQPLEGVVELLNTLSNHSKLAIITNGFTQLQQVRLQNTGLADYFSTIITSEEAGVAKPDPAIFNYALEQIQHTDRKSVLMVGDNPHSDILGANKAGFDSCWLNVNKQPLPDHIAATYQVHSMVELEGLIKSLSSNKP
ncbi:dUMP phosphatase [Marinomonas agarivorans]|nr:dUMP phosphatase [Marinomonas agarivorans]